MTTIFRLLRFLLLAPVVAVVIQAASWVQDDFCIVDTGFQSKPVIQECTSERICNCDSSGALLQQRSSLDGKGDDDDWVFQLEKFESKGAELSLFAFFSEFVAARGVANPVPSTMARVIPEGIPATTLGRPGASDVFVTAADDIAGMNASQIAKRLGIPESPTGFRVIEFPTPSSGVASPVFRTDPGFVGGGRTLGGAREFVIPNGPIPAGSTIWTVP